MGSKGRVETGDDACVRFDLCVPVEYRGSGCEGVGFVRNISRSGARIERSSVTVTQGMMLGIRFSTFLGSFAAELPSQVVRLTDTGFAVRFVELERDQVKMLRAMLRLPWDSAR